MNEAAEMIDIVPMAPKDGDGLDVSLLPVPNLAHTAKDEVEINESRIVPQVVLDILALPKSITIYGREALGKSTDVLKAFPSAFYIFHSTASMQRYISEVETQIIESGREPTPAELAKVMPRFSVIKEYTLTDEGVPVKVDNYAQVMKLVSAFLKRCAKDRKLPEGHPEKRNYTALVLDEATTLFKRMLDDLQNVDAYPQFATDKGKVNTRDVYKALATFERYLARVVPEAAEKSFVLVCNERGPETFEGTYNAGGPELASRGQTRDLAHDSDFMFQFAHEPVPSDAPEGTMPSRVILTASDKHFRRKARHVRVQAIERGDLTSIMKKARVSHG